MEVSGYPLLLAVLEEKGRKRCTSRWAGVPQVSADTNSTWKRQQNLQVPCSLLAPTAHPGSGKDEVTASFFTRVVWPAREDRTYTSWAPSASLGWRTGSRLKPQYFTKVGKDRSGVKEVCQTDQESGKGIP